MIKLVAVARWFTGSLAVLSGIGILVCLVLSGLKTITNPYDTIAIAQYGLLAIILIAVTYLLAVGSIGLSVFKEHLKNVPSARCNKTSA